MDVREKSRVRAGRERVRHMRPESQEILPRGIQFTHQLRLWKGMKGPGGIHTRLQGLFAEHYTGIKRGKVKGTKALKRGKVRLCGGKITRSETKR